MAAWWVAEGMAELFNAIWNASTDQLEQHFAALSDDDRGRLVVIWNELRTKLLEVCKQKVAFWQHVPWRCLGVFYCCKGSSLERAKALLR